MKTAIRVIAVILMSLSSYAVSPTIVSRLTQTGLLADLPATTLYTPPTTGLFRVSTYVTCNTIRNGVCSGTLVEYDYTDEYAAQAVQVTNSTIPSASFAVTTFHALGGDPITVSTMVHPDGVNTYNLYVVVERIGD